MDSGEYTSNGHGLDSRYNNGSGGEGENKDYTRRKYTPDMITPKFHYEHPYKDEIETLEYRSWQLEALAVQSKTVEQIKQDNCLAIKVPFC